VSLKSPLVPLAVIALSFGQLVLAGRDATRTVVENLANPHASKGARLVHLVHGSTPVGRVHELTFKRPENGPTFLSGSARMKVQLWSKGRTRILVLRPAGSDPSRWQAFLDVLRGRGRLQMVADRSWIDLGPVPADGAPLAVQVAGLLPGPYGFAELKTPADPVFEDVRVLRPGAESAPARPFPRYRISTPAPVDAQETLARFFFFISISRVLQVAGLVALALLFFGWWLAGRDRTTSAVCCLIPSVVLLHAVCLPPLQGADETSHGATIEALLFRGMPITEGSAYPRSWSLAAEWLEQDRVQYQPDEPLPLESAEGRGRLAAILGPAREREAAEKGPEPPAAYVQSIDSRAPLFFRPFGLLGRALRPLPLVDRISAYRLLSALSGLALFAAGALLIFRAGLPESVTLAHAAVWMIPYMVFTTASISNYSTAIGLGSLLAASAVVVVLTEKRKERFLAAIVLVTGSWVGIPVWPDFIFLAAAGALILLIAGLLSATRRLALVPRAAVLGVSTAVLLGAGAFLTRIALQLKAGNIGTRMPENLPKSLDRNAFWMIVAALAPLLAASVLAAALHALRKLPDTRAGSFLTGASAATAAILLAGFLLTPWTFIPYETDRYWFSKLVREHAKVFLSNSLSWDQDALSWKFWVGAGGWHDLFLPDWLYAVWRWLSVLALLLVPVAAARWLRERRPGLPGLVGTAALGLTLCVATEIVRYVSPGNPWGRFALPWYPLILVPLGTLLFTGSRRGAGEWFIRLGALLLLWVSITLTGMRYAL
jgi:hypothetical protein